MTMVSSLVTMMFLHCPRTDGSLFSRVRPTSSEMTVPPVRMAMSLRIAFLLSPKAGALTATQPRAFYSVAEMAFLQHHLETHPDQLATFQAASARGALMCWSSTCHRFCTVAVMMRLPPAAPTTK